MERTTLDWIEIDADETPNPIYDSVEEIPADVLDGAEDAVICLSNEDEVDLSKNENGWAAYGTTLDGNHWETDDFERLEVLVDSLITGINERASANMG